MDETPAWMPFVFFGALAIGSAAGIAFVNWLMRREHARRQEQAGG